MGKTSIKKNSAIAGEIKLFAGTNVPSGWLLCDGTAVSRTTYSTLFNVVGTSFGSGDGSTTFNLPDFREASPVGAGQNELNTIAAHDTYTVGQFKDDQIQSHTHSYNYPSAVSANGFAGGSSIALTPSGNTTGGASGRTGTVTHGKRLGVNFIIYAGVSA